MKGLSGSMNDPWMVIGDFNSILSANDKRGGATFSRARNKSFIHSGYLWRCRSPDPRSEIHLG
ncbi:hypothetical protein LINPERHAP2_LOCUS7065 [Linum perenne]